MSKSANDTLFGITLTELVIILFFIMLLLAMANIQELTDRIPENEDDIVPASTVIDLLIPNGEINSDLIPLDLIKEEIAKLQEDKEELEEMKQLAEGEGDGDCKEGGNWIQPKCNDFCWEIDEEANDRKFDYLVDIGVCNDSIVVQRSEWLEKNALDFLDVDGAFELVDSQAITRQELYQFLDTIKEPGYIKEPKQCFHMARLIDLQGVSGDLWNKNGREIRERLGTTDYTSSIAGHKRLRDTFPEDVCELPAAKKIIKKEERKVTPIKNEPISQTYSQSEGSLESEQVITSSINRVAPKINQKSFRDNFQDHRSCRGIRSDKMTPRYRINLDETGKVTAVSLVGDLSSFSRNQKTLDKVTREALMRTSFSPESIEGIALAAEIILPITLEKNACQAR